MGRVGAWTGGRREATEGELADGGPNAAGSVSVEVEGTGTGSEGVGDKEVLLGIEDVAGGRTAYLEVEVGATGGTGVAAPGNGVAGMERHGTGGKGGVDGEGLATVLEAADETLDVGGEAGEMAIEGDDAVGMRDVEGVAIARGRNGDAKEVAVAHADDGVAFLAVGLKVEAGVEMGGPQFTEVAAEEGREMEGVAKGETEGVGSAPSR